jgi:DNA-binding LacI/PurR family transcriptional regulator
MTHNPSSKKVTIKDVARACDVSIQTVSRVLNNRSDVSKATREKVQTVIDGMGYQPNILARGMRRQSDTLGVIISGLHHKGVATTLNGVARASEERGYTLIFKETASLESEDVLPFIRSLMAHQVRGIICAAPQVGTNWTSLQKSLPAKTPPLVFLKGNPLAAPITISIDNYAAGYKATCHMIEQGYGHIAHISGPSDWWEAQERQRGWRQALMEAGLPIPASALTEGDWTPASGCSGFTRLREAYPEMDAVFAANDQMALGVMQAAWQQGVNVPEGLGVAGMDDLSESAFFTPPLTTVRQNFYQLGELAVRKLLRLADMTPEDDAVAADTLVIQPELIVRQSTNRNGE